MRLFVLAEIRCTYSAHHTGAKKYRWGHVVQFEGFRAHSQLLHALRGLALNNVRGQILRVLIRHTFHRDSVTIRARCYWDGVTAWRYWRERCKPRYNLTSVAINEINVFVLLEYLKSVAITPLVVRYTNNLTRRSVRLRSNVYGGVYCSYRSPKSRNNNCYNDLDQLRRNR